MKNNLNFRIITFCAILLNIITILYYIQLIKNNQKQKTILYDQKQKTIPYNQKQKTILYISRHNGTIDDMSYVASSLNMSITCQLPTHKYGDVNRFMMTKESLMYKNIICESFDFIIVGDTNPDGIEFLVDVNKCRSTIIIHTTNRFDWISSYHFNIILNQAFNEHPSKVLSVVNNPSEIIYMNKKGVYPTKYHLIRPTGYTRNYNMNDSKEVIDKKNTKAGKMDKLVLIDKDYYHKELVHSMNLNNITFDVYSNEYGGPKTLLRYKAYIFIPYQTSVMSFMQNLKVGVVYMIPSIDLYIELYLNSNVLLDLHDFRYNTTKLNIKQKLNKRFKKYMEWWNDDLKDIVIYFDSWKDLKYKLVDSKFDCYSNNSIKYADKISKKSLEQWSDILT